VSPPASESRPCSDRSSEGLRPAESPPQDNEGQTAGQISDDAYSQALDRLICFGNLQRNRTNLKRTIAVTACIALGLACLVYLMISLTHG
jgi:hypothetical protein